MAGTLTISTLSDGTNSTSSTNCIQGSAKAWVRFNGAGGATINASYNVSSVTRTGTGIYYATLTNAMSDASYSAVASATYAGVANVYAQTPSYGPGGTATSSRAYIGVIASGSVSDADQISLAIFR